MSKETDEKAALKRDRILVKEAVAGKPEVFAQLMSLYQNRVHAVGMSFFHNLTDTEDFVQEVFIKAFTNLASFRGESRFSTWLTRIAYTTAINAKNRVKEYETLTDEDFIKSPSLTPEDEHIRSATIDSIREAVQNLPERYGICLDMYFFYDLSHEEIARITGFPINTIKSHIFRAKKILCKKLSGLK